MDFCALLPMTHSACLGPPWSASTQHSPDATAMGWSRAPSLGTMGCTPEPGQQAQPWGATSRSGCGRGAGDIIWGVLGSSTPATAPGSCSLQLPLGRWHILSREARAAGGEDTEPGSRLAGTLGCRLHRAALCQPRRAMAHEALPHQAPLLQPQTLEKPPARPAGCKGWAAGEGTHERTQALPSVAVGKAERRRERTGGSWTELPPHIHVCSCSFYKILYLHICFVRGFFFSFLFLFFPSPLDATALPSAGLL